MRSASIVFQQQYAGNTNSTANPKDWIGGVSLKFYFFIFLFLTSFISTM